MGTRYVSWAGAERKKDESKGMVSLKLSEKEAKKTHGEAPKAELPEWPYGFRLTFESEQISKFPQLKDAKVGQKVTVRATGEVMSTREEDRQGDKERHTVEIQLKEIGVETK